MLNVFLEKYLPNIIGAILIGVILVNPKKWDGVQRVSLGIAGIAFLVFASRTLSNKNQAPSETKPATQLTAPAQPTATGDAKTDGDGSPAVTGNGNSFNYNQAPPKKDKPTPPRKSNP